MICVLVFDVSVACDESATAGCYNTDDDDDCVAVDVSSVSSSPQLMFWTSSNVTG